MTPDASRQLWTDVYAELARERSARTARRIGVIVMSLRVVGAAVLEAIHVWHG